MRVAPAWCLAVFLCAPVLPGCVSEPVPAQTGAAPPQGSVPADGSRSNPEGIVTPDTGLEGKITWLDSNLRFVVITFSAGHAPALDQRLNVYRKGLKVGEIKITGPQRDDSIVGDVVAGEAGPGDAVRDR
jgi:hypothetical protein